MKLLNKVTTDWWAMGLISLVVVIMYLPARFMEFSWVDDGYVFYASKQLLDNLAGGKFGDVWFFLTEYGFRFRPVYWFWQAVNYLLSGYDPQLHYFWHFVMLLMIALLLFKITRKYCQSSSLGLFASLLFMVSPVNAENWYRLGPQEPLVVLLILISVIIWQKFNKPLLGGGVFLLAILTKEPVFAFLIPFIIVYLYQLITKHKRDQDIEKYVILGTFGFCLIMLPRLFGQIITSPDYQINLPVVWGNFIGYIGLLHRGFSPYLEILFLVFCARWLWWWRNHRKNVPGSLCLSGICLLITVSYLLVLSPWRYVIYRYLLPATLPLVIFLGLQLEAIFKRFGKVALGIFMGLFLIQQSYSLLTVYHIGVYAANTTRTVQALYRHVAKTAGQDSYLLLNLPNDLELTFEAEIYLHKYYNRPDIKVIFFNDKQLPEGPIILATTTLLTPVYTEAQIASVGIRFSQEDIVIDDYLPMFTSPRYLVPRVIKNITMKVVKKQPFTLDGIYSTNKISNSWNLKIGSRAGAYHF
jgi:hypothetical protein